MLYSFEHDHLHRKTKREVTILFRKANVVQILRDLSNKLSLFQSLLLIHPVKPVSMKRLLKIDNKQKSLADLGGACRAHSPLWDPILSFLHTFSLKSARVVGPCPPNGCTPPYGKSWIRHWKSLIKVEIFCCNFTQFSPGLCKLTK